MNFKINMDKLEDGLKLCKDVMNSSGGRETLEYKAGFDTGIILGMLEILTESGVIEVTKVRKKKVVV